MILLIQVFSKKKKKNLDIDSDAEYELVDSITGSHNF